MNIFKLLQNPLVKIIGVGAVLYFGLIYKNDSPESLKTRLNPDRIKSEIDEAKEKSQFIVANLNGASKAQNLQEKVAEITTNDLILGNSNETVKCGDEALVDYRIYNAKGLKLDHKKDIKLNAGDEANLIAKYIVGARKGAVREIHVPQDFITENAEILQYQKIAGGAFKYQVNIKTLTALANAQNCQNYEKK